MSESLIKADFHLADFSSAWRMSRKSGWNLTELFFFPPPFQPLLSPSLTHEKVIEQEYTQAKSGRNRALSLSFSLFLYGRAASGLHSTLVASPKHLHACQWKEREYRIRKKRRYKDATDIPLRHWVFVFRCGCPVSKSCDSVGRVLLLTTIRCLKHIIQQMEFVHIQEVG